jgi:AAHS family 3-hydroxyphenylpropionic acid transporter
MQALLLNVGAVAGSLLFGRALDRARAGPILLLVYCGMLGALAALLETPDRWISWTVVSVGFFVIGGQLVLYALAPIFYPTAIRGTGVGAAVAVGRLGSILGPLLAGFALSHGLAPAAVPVIAIPGIALAMGAALLLVARYPVTSEMDRR